MTKAMFISVHPDDETFGCGGSILKHKANGDNIVWLNLTNIFADHPYGFSEQQINDRNLLIDKVKAEYKFDEFINLSFPTIMLDTIVFGKLVQAIDQVICINEPQVIYMPNRSDVHSDHKIAFEAIYACTKNFRKPFINQLLMYETLSETEFAPALADNAFVPNYYTDISDYFDRKIEILKLYETEIMPDPLPRSIHAVTGLAAYRGSRIGVKYAEAFMNLLTIR
jgi:LmbE family N-acetylglucosaminyl deacetylase